MTTRIDPFRNLSGKPSVLLVEDEPGMLRSLVKLLPDFETYSAGPDNPADQARLLWKSHPQLQLAIVDLFIPAQSVSAIKSGSPDVGLTLIEDLKFERTNSSILVFSAWKREYGRRAIQRGADALFDKGELEELLAGLRHFAANLISPVKPRGEALWSELQKNSGDSVARARALLDLVHVGNPNLPGFVIKEISQCQLEDERWVCALVVAVCELQFTDSDQRLAVRQSLLRLAHDLRSYISKTDKTGMEESLWAVLRRYASLVPDSEALSSAEEIAVFLDAKNSIRLNQAALLCVQIILGKNCPSSQSNLNLVRQKTVELADKCFSPSIPEAGPQAALAIETVRTLTVLGDPSLLRIARRIRKDADPWLIGLVKRNIEAVIRDLRKQNGDVALDAIRCVEASLRVLDCAEGS